MPRTAVSVAVWVRLEAVTDSQVFVSRAGAGEQFTFYVFDGRVRMLIEYRPGRYAYAAAPLPPPGVPTHYLGTWDGAQVRIYRNGLAAGVAVARGAMPPSNAPVCIGALEGRTRFLHGALAHIQVWGRSLDADDAVGLAANRNDTRRLSRGRLAWWTPASGRPAVLRNRAVQEGTLAMLHETPAVVGKVEDGYRGIWYSNQPTGNEYAYKYSGGLGTYCAKHIPMAVHSPETRKTFFCWGGRPADRNVLWHMIGVFDHRTRRVSRPVFLLNKHTDDAHDNPVLQIDAHGFVWVFSSAHGTARPGFIHRSLAPFSIDRFEQVLSQNFSYPQPWVVPDQGFVFLQTLYRKGRRFLFSSRSPDGRTWDEPVCYACMDEGHYQVSWPWKNKVGTAFNYHPAGKGLNWRTNLYYMETLDGGRTWRTVDGKRLETPLRRPQSRALVHDYAAEGWNVYMKDLNYDAEGGPVILYLLSRGWRPGPEDGPRVWQTAHWTGSRWDIRRITESDNCYDTGCLHVESNGVWRLIAPTEPGPQPYNPGGEVAMWLSRDEGRSWRKTKQLTHNSQYNHNYCRRPLRAAPAFYAFWADGNPREPSASRLYFTDRAGSHVWRLPGRMTTDWEVPEVVR
ncbi:MAG: hypothetical protein GXP31_09400 [Kiritimatiellaeota bacterium]|nr:hypothetical protein [Kiritimatiellota bacterium]